MMNKYQLISYALIVVPGLIAIISKNSIIRIFSIGLIVLLVTMNLILAPGAYVRAGVDNVDSNQSAEFARGWANGMVEMMKMTDHDRFRALLAIIIISIVAIKPCAKR